MGWWRRKPLCLPLLCKTVLHPKPAVKVGRIERTGISLKILSQKALFHSSEARGRSKDERTAV